MCPPGLAIVSVSGRVLAASPSRRAFYFDWERTSKAQEKLDAAFTPAVSLIRSLDVALGLILDEGLEAAFERHVAARPRGRAGVKAMGLELFSPDDDRSAVVTAIRAPDGIDATSSSSTSRPARRHARDGQGDLKGKIFRIGHIGWFDVFDIATALAAVELVAVGLGRRDRARRRRHRARSRPVPSTRPSRDATVLVREAIAEAGDRPAARRSFDVDVDADSDLDEIIGALRRADRPLGDEGDRGPDRRARRTAEGDRPRRRRRRQRRRRRGDAARHRRRERARVERRLGGGAHDRPARRARAQHPAGARGARRRAAGSARSGVASSSPTRRSACSGSAASAGRSRARAAGSA